MIKIYTDGACQPNPGHMGKGIVIEWQGKKPTIISEYIGEGTNNIAEYTALIDALEIIRDENIKVCTIYSDSNLMVNQVNNIWSCKDYKLKPLQFKAQKRIEWLINKGWIIKLEYIPREFNLADKPAKDGANKRKDAN